MTDVIRTPYDDLPAGVRRANWGWFGEHVAEDPSIGERMIAAAERVFDQPGVLPGEPDIAAAEAWLLSVRREFYR